MTFSLKHFFLSSLVACGVFAGCGERAASEDQKRENDVADSISIKLNSPELKKVNDELRNDPSSHELYYKRAGVYMGLQKYPEATGDLIRAIRIDSMHAEYFLRLADVYFAQNKTRLAKESLERTVHAFPDNKEGLMKLSELYFIVQKYQEAIDYANKALKLDANLAKAYFLKGNIYRESGDTAKAISNLMTAIEQDNKYKDAYQDLAVIHAARRNPIAFDFYTNALKLAPKDVQLLYGRAKLLQDLGKYDDAIADYGRALLADGKCYDCYYNLGAVYLEVKKDYGKALENFTKAIATNPSVPEAYFARGYTYVLLKDKANAKSDFNMCLKLDAGHRAAKEELSKL